MLMCNVQMMDNHLRLFLTCEQHYILVLGWVKNVCVPLCIFCYGTDRNADGILMQWLILTTRGELATAAIAADLVK